MQVQEPPLALGLNSESSLDEGDFACARVRTCGTGACGWRESVRYYVRAYPVLRLEHHAVSMQLRLEGGTDPRRSLALSHSIAFPPLQDAQAPPTAGMLPRWLLMQFN